MSVHTSRTMMLQELRLILERVDADVPASSYVAAIMDDNVLGKPTRSTRQRTAQHLTDLYALDARCTLFRFLHHFWAIDADSQPMLAFLVACARAPLLCATTPFVLTIPLGSTVQPRDIADFVQEHCPLRFQPSILLATAQRLASSWMQAGYLQGKKTKRRTRPQVTPIVTAYALVLAYLSGLGGARLLDSVWARLLDCSSATLTEFTVETSKQGGCAIKPPGHWLRSRSPSC